MMRDHPSFELSPNLPLQPHCYVAGEKNLEVLYRLAIPFFLNTKLFLLVEGDSRSAIPNPLSFSSFQKIAPFRKFLIRSRSVSSDRAQHNDQVISRFTVLDAPKRLDPSWRRFVLPLSAQRLKAHHPPSPQELWAPPLKDQLKRVFFDKKLTRYLLSCHGHTRPSQGLSFSPLPRNVPLFPSLR